MSGGGSYGSPSGPQPFGPGQNQSFNPNPYSSGSSAAPYSAFGPTKAAGGSGFDPSQMGMVGGNMSYGGIDPSQGGSFNPYGSMGSPFDPNAGMPGGNMSPYGGGNFNPYGGMTGGNMAYGNPFGGMDFSQLSQFLQSPYMGGQMQQPQAPQAPQQPSAPYYQTGQQQPMPAQAPQPPNADQTFLDGFNRSYGTRYDAMSQLPANDYQNYLRTSGQQQQPLNPYAKTANFNGG